LNWSEPSRAFSLANKASLELYVNARFDDSRVESEPREIAD